MQCELLDAILVSWLRKTLEDTRHFHPEATVRPVNDLTGGKGAGNKQYM